VAGAVVEGVVCVSAGAVAGGCVVPVVSGVLSAGFCVPSVVAWLEWLASVVLLLLSQAHRLNSITSANSIASTFFIVYPFLSIKSKVRSRSDAPKKTYPFAAILRFIA
jgi:hypothetical protein